MLTQSLLPCRFLAPVLALLFAHTDLSARPFRSSSFSERAKPAQVCPDLVKAARIAEANARSHSIKRCWRYVKRALVAANVVDSYPQGVSAKYAGSELTRRHGFVKLENITRPTEAPVGAVLVYGGRGHGHVEFRTQSGFVSDFKASKPSKRPLTGVYVKRSGS